MTSDSDPDQTPPAPLAGWESVDSASANVQNIPKVTHGETYILAFVLCKYIFLQGYCTLTWQTVLAGVKGEKRFVHFSVVLITGLLEDFLRWR